MVDYGCPVNTWYASTFVSQLQSLFPCPVSAFYSASAAAPKIPAVVDNYPFFCASNFAGEYIPVGQLGSVALFRTCDHFLSLKDNHEILFVIACPSAFSISCSGFWP